VHEKQRPPGQCQLSLLQPGSTHRVFSAKRWLEGGPERGAGAGGACCNRRWSLFLVRAGGAAAAETEAAGRIDRLWWKRQRPSLLPEIGWLKYAKSEFVTCSRTLDVHQLTCTLPSDSRTVGPGASLRELIVDLGENVSSNRQPRNGKFLLSNEIHRA